MTDTPNTDHLSDERISDDEWADRRLCLDGNCIGVIGPDGRCKECGLPGGEDRPAAGTALPDPSHHTENDAEDVDQTEAASSDIPSDPAADDWDNRRLCPDGNCIGVIGADGRCKECGRPEEGT